VAFPGYVGRLVETFDGGCLTLGHRGSKVRTSSPGGISTLNRFLSRLTRTATGLAGCMWAHGTTSHMAPVLSASAWVMWARGVVGSRVDTSKESWPTPRRLSQSTCTDPELLAYEREHHGDEADHPELPGTALPAITAATAHTGTSPGYGLLGFVPAYVLEQLAAESGVSDRLRGSIGTPRLDY
jgi:hypothetical protein